jgi:hypothetical protein
MSAKSTDVFPYLLVDNGLLHGTRSHYAETQESPRPDWLEPIYADKALAVSPLLIDIGAAYEAGQLDRMMELANACKPALHTSLIETSLTLVELAQHLRRLIFVVAPDGKQYTLRFADCVVLSTLSTVLTPVQWAAVSDPMTRWCVHDRDGLIRALPPAPGFRENESGHFPFQLSDHQIDDMTEALEADHVLAKVKAKPRGIPLPGNTREQHEWACAALSRWREAGNTSALMLASLVEAALSTKGEILRRHELGRLLSILEVASFRDHLRELVGDMEERRVRLQKMAAEPVENVY